MRNLRHENLNQFLGVCATPPYQCIVTLYAKYGSLRDVIADELQKITPEFKLSFLIDTSSVSGENYFCFIHENSSNVMDMVNFVCKLGRPFLKFDNSFAGLSC